MAASSRFGMRIGTIKLKPQALSNIQIRLSNTLQNHTVEKHRSSVLNHDRERRQPQPTLEAPRDYKYVYPEFIPQADVRRRDRIAEMLQRRDMMRRRAVVDIPEFYVGSVLAVTVSDPYAPGKKNRFVGICIDRGGIMLQAHFVLRNVVDGQGVEIMYEMYNPTIQKVEVLRLEQRLDESLYYLRDAPQEFSTFSFDMEPVPHPPGAPVPINQLKVPLNPVPWHERWERKELKGAILPPISEKRQKNINRGKKPWLEHDLMHQYRTTINEDETQHIMSEVYSTMRPIEKQHSRKKMSIVKKN